MQRPGPPVRALPRTPSAVCFLCPRVEKVALLGLSQEDTDIITGREEK